VSHLHATSHDRRPIERALSACVAALASLGVATPALAASPPTLNSTALAITSPTPARHVHGTDGREHVEYDLLITNAFSAAATLKSLEVWSDGRLLLRVKGAALAASTHAILGEAPVARVPPSVTVATVVDLVLPRSARPAAHRRLANLIRYSLPADTPSLSLIGRTTVNAPTVSVVQRPPIVIGSAVRGSGWYDANGCCADSTAPHRVTVLARNGTYVTPEWFAIDWVRVVHGSIYTGTGSRLRDWRGTYGARIYAVANGIVVAAVDGRPDIAPFADPLLNGPEDFAGNSVVLKIAPRQYAVFFHLKRGSVRVKVGERVRGGEQIASLGNSGNSSAPHLHFGIQDGPSGLSNSLPFEIDRLRLEGNVVPGATLPKVNVAATPQRLRRALPLINSVIDVSPRHAS
jgi:hypothetical protein